MKKLLPILFLVSLSAGAETITCMQSDECPGDLICQTDETMHGVCVPPGPRAGATQTTGKVGDPCSYVNDCQPGYICARPRGFKDPYGSCQPDRNHDLKE